MIGTASLMTLWHPFSTLPAWAFIIFAFIGSSLAHSIASWVFARRSFPAYRTYRYTSIDPSVPTFVLRATRDEASLTIGLAQSVHALMNFIYAIEDSPEAGLIRKSLVLLSLWPITLTILDALASVGNVQLPVGLIRAVILWVIFGDGLAGLLRCLGFGVLAGAVGYWDVRGWGCNSIEVDAVPPNKDCSVRTQFDLERAGGAPTTLRHGIYESAEIQAEIGFVLQSVSAGLKPRLRTAVEMKDAREKCEQGLRRLQYRRYRHWQERQERKKKHNGRLT